MTDSKLAALGSLLIRKDSPTVTDVHIDSVDSGGKGGMFRWCPMCAQRLMSAACGKCGWGEKPEGSKVETRQVPLAKSIAAKRFTSSPVYIANREDAHGEWTDPDALQEAMWGLTKAARVDPDSAKINLQHLPGVNIGEWVELGCIPFDHDVTLTIPGEGVRKVRMPAGTPYMGVLWEPPAWAEVQAGRLRGLSMEGTSPRTYADIPTLAG